MDVFCGLVNFFSLGIFMDFQNLTKTKSHPNEHFDFKYNILKIAARFRINCTPYILYCSLHTPQYVQEVRRIPCILLHRHPGLWFLHMEPHTLTLRCHPPRQWRRLKITRYVNECLIACTWTFESSSQLFWMHTHNKSWWSLNLHGVQGLIMF